MLEKIEGGWESSTLGGIWEWGREPCIGKVGGESSVLGGVWEWGESSLLRYLGVGIFLLYTGLCNNYFWQQYNLHSCALFVMQALDLCNVHCVMCTLGPCTLSYALLSPALYTLGPSYSIFLHIGPLQLENTHDGQCAVDIMKTNQRNKINNRREKCSAKQTHMK